MRVAARHGGEALQGVALTGYVNSTKEKEDEKKRVGKRRVACLGEAVSHHQCRMIKATIDGGEGLQFGAMIAGCWQ
ncbi:hypothetical protein Ancab_028601 [Ancistrocladus abbreviatus]